ncbi:hypothetical protein [Clostridium beijerinckii]|uniref:Uncharacterized protein n=1 Tax=Clostridium beijerinckii TaxID=1520 RepID=A0A1S8SAH2_CLOBE|nr:hypothetical protein [Clostridium beijerinckii]NRY60869.1 hypothetical protein [Clostridium beijerinckii]OOM62312.1 hypothetical protein CLBCK_18500 [Clostridium beijerinckii]
MNYELDAKLEQYYNKFGDVFPMMEYDLSKKEVIKFIDKCLKLNKKAQEIISLRNDVIY